MIVHDKLMKMTEADRQTYLAKLADRDPKALIRVFESLEAIRLLNRGLPQQAVKGVPTVGSLILR